MKKKEKHGEMKSWQFSGSETFAHIESLISESISSDHLIVTSSVNGFSRKIVSANDDSISFATGTTVCGLRSGVWIQNPDNRKIAEGLSYANRLHLPVVITIVCENGNAFLKYIGKGPVIWMAHSLQEYADLLLIAHKTAEEILSPCVILLPEYLVDKKEEIQLPTKKAILAFSGNTDDRINSPTPSQIIIFGESRRRIPIWFNADNPVSIGASQSKYAKEWEAAANETYFHSHIFAGINQVLDSYQQVSDKRYNSFITGQEGQADYLIVGAGVPVNELEEATRQAKQSNKIKAGYILLSRLTPFPADELLPMLTNKKGIIILSHANDEYLLDRLISLNVLSTAKISNFVSGSPFSSATLQSGLAHLVDKNQIGKKYWLNIPLVPDASKSPKKEILAQTIKRFYPQAETGSIFTPAIFDSIKENLSGRINQNIRKFKDSGAPYSQVSRFFTQSLNLDSDPQLPPSADPFFALPILPPQTASFVNPLNKEASIPQFIPAQCTGCGDCMVYCPHSAIVSYAGNIENLLRSAIASAVAKGEPVNLLMPQIKNLAKMAVSIINETKTDACLLREIISPAFEKLVKVLALDEEKSKIAEKELEVILAQNGDLKLAITDQHYRIPEKIENGSGNLFHISTDLNACTGCGICIRNCPEDALIAVKAKQSELSGIQNQFHIWEALPDTDGHTIEKLLDDNSYSSIASILLSRNFNMHMHGAIRDEKHEDEKIVFHLLNSIAESVLQPNQKELIDKVEGLLGKMSSNIHDILGEALPRSNFENLMKSVNEVKGEKKPFDQLIELLGSKEHMKLIDTDILQRKLNLTDSLRQLLHLLKDGPTGAGRSRQSIIMDNTIEWAGKYPWNLFSDPILMITPNEITGKVNGIVQSLIRHTLDNLRLIKRAELEIKNKYEPDIHNRQIAGLEWDQLSSEEKKTIPAITVVLRKENLFNENIEGLTDLIKSGPPVKFFILDASTNPVTPASITDQTSISLLISFIALQSAYVAKVSLASQNNFFNRVVETYQYNGPAILWVLAPNAKLHNEHIPKTALRHAFAVNTRAFAELVYNPTSAPGQLSDGIKIDTNPSFKQAFTSSLLQYMIDENQTEVSYSMTWADWAYTLKGLEKEFTPYSAQMGSPTPIAEYLDLDIDKRSGLVPVIYRVGSKKELQQFVASKKIIGATIASRAFWNIFTEISGENSSIPEKSRKQIEEKLSAAFEDEKDKIIAGYESKIASLEEEFMLNVKSKLRENLLRLSQKTKSNKTSPS